MTWLYIPSVSAQASEDSTSVCELPNPERAASLTWRGKPAQRQALSRAWKRGGFIRLLSGLTCEPSTLEHGAALWIASCQAIPAKETASPENGLVRTTTDGCSTARSRFLIKAGLKPSSVRTSSGIAQDSSLSPSRHWSDWAAALRSEFSARARPEQVIDASAYSSSQSDPWPTPAARDYKGANSKDHVTTNGSGRMHMDQLPNFVEHAFQPSPPDPATSDGPTSSRQRRSLNPLFVEWLMGWPIGLSGFETAGMASCLSQPPSRGCDCMDCWLMTQRAMLSDLLTIEPPAQASFL